MKETVKKRLKRVGVGAGVSIAVLLLIIALIINFILTPARLTPFVLGLANESLNARLEMESVEVTFFSTFPKFGVRLTDGSLVARLSDDSIPPRQDSLVSFSQCVVTVNPVAYLVKKRLSLHRLRLTDASVYAFKAADGRCNWDIVKASADTLPADGNDRSTGLSGGIDLRRVSLENVSLVFDDRTTGVYAAVNGLNLRMRASLSDAGAKLKLDMNNRKLLFWQRGELWVDRVASSVKTDLEIDWSTQVCRLKNTVLDINGVRFGAAGELKRDTVRQVFDVDFRYGLKVPSVETVLAMIPESVVKKSAVSAKGSVKMEGKIAGEYGRDLIPALSVCIRIEDASAQYEGLPYGIERLSADFDAYVDMTKRTPSYADLKIFRFKGADTDISAMAKIEELLGDPKITFETKTTTDLHTLTRIFPFQDSIRIAGKLDADLKLKCRLSSLRKQDIGRIAVQGKICMDALEIVDSAHGFDFAGDAAVDFSGDETLQARAEVDSLVLKSSRLVSNVEKMTATIRSTNPQDTTRIVTLEGNVELKRLEAAMPTDSIRLYSGKTAATVRIAPGKRNPAMPLVGLSLHTDSVMLGAAGNRLWIDKAGFDLNAQKIRDSLWIPRGTIGFDELCIETEAFRLPVCLRNTEVSVRHRDILLKNATARVGSSDLVASGSVHNLLGALMRKEPVKANLDIRSEAINCTEIVDALAVSEEVAVSDSSDSKMRLFVIPPNIDFSLNTRIEKVTFDRMLFENVDGQVEVRDQYLHLENLSMQALDADMKAVMVYKASDADDGYTGIDFRIHDINVGKLVDFIPALDTIVPMLRSFKGRVDFDVSAETSLDSAVNIRLNDLKAAVHIQGDSLVLMDGETFAEISKMLMFKNKKENVFDSISVNLTVMDGNVTVYPFLVEIDRYRAAVGGKQGLDMNFDYHISILKSPLPFKAGVNIRGNLDKMKFGIGKAKYKDAVSPVNIRRIDSTRLHMGYDIVANFRKMLKTQQVESDEVLRELDPEPNRATGRRRANPEVVGP